MYEHKSYINLEVLSLLLHGCVQCILLLLYSNRRIYNVGQTFQSKETVTNEKNTTPYATT